MANAELAINIVARNQAKSALNAIKGDMKGIQSSLSGMMKIAAGNFISSAAIGSVKALSGAIGGVVGAFNDASNASAEFNAQISSIGAVAGASQQQLEGLKDLALDLGVNPNLKVSAVEAAEAIEMLARNGMKIPDIMAGAAEATVLLANATGAEFGTAADIGTDAMALFDIKATEMMSAVDGITSVVNNSKFSINDYRLALAQGGGVAATVGVEFDDFNTTIAAIAPLFGSGSDAGTSFKTFLQRLVPTSKPAIIAMKELGLMTSDGSNAFFDAQGNLKSMAEITGLMNRATRDLTEEQKNQYLTTIFGSDAMRAAAGVAGLTRDQFEALQKTMGETDALKSAGQRMDNLAGDMEIFRSVVESTRLQVGDEFDGSWRKLYQAGSSAISGLLPQITALAKAFNANVFAPAIDAFVGKLNEVVAIVKEAKTLSGGLFAGLGALTGGEISIDASGLVTQVTWGDFIGTLDWSSYVFSIEWGEFIALWNWQDAITILGWGDYIVGVDWDDWLFSLKWSDYVYELSWTDVVAKLDAWSTYIENLTWSDVVSELTDWSGYIGTLYWDSFATALDWALYVTNLTWDSYVKTLDWSTMVAAFTNASWGGYIETLTWDKFVSDLGGWQKFVGMLNWTTYITPFVWSQYLSKVDWSTYVSTLNWRDVIADFGGWAGYITNLNLVSFVTKLNWSEFVGRFIWPAVEWLGWSEFVNDFAWPTVEWAGWAEFIDSFVWPSVEWVGWSEFVDQFTWPTVSWPGWSEFITGVNLKSYVPSFPGWDSVLNSINPFGGGSATRSDGSIAPSGSNIKGNANGTDFWEGGWSWVGEKGPELLNLPRGSRVLSNPDSKKMIGQLADGTGEQLPSRTGGLFNNIAQTLGFSITSMQRTWDQATGFIVDALEQNTGAVEEAAAVQQNSALSAQTAATQNAASIATVGDMIRASASQFAAAATQSGSFVLNGVGHFTESFSDLLGSFGDNLDSALQNVPGLFGASQVTGDQMRMAELGIPQNFADDWLRRLTDEVVNGVDWEGVDIQDAARRAGLDPTLPANAILEMVTQAWNDRSLFADKGNLDLFNVDVIQQELMRQQASEAGTANIMALFGVTPEQATQAGVNAGTKMRSGVVQGLQTGGTDASAPLAESIAGEVDPEQFAAVGIAAVEGIAAEIGKTENTQKVIEAIARVFGDVKAYGDLFADASRSIMTSIASGFGDIGDIDVIGRMASGMRQNLALESSIDVLREFGARVLEYVYQGYKEAAKDKDWPGATVGPAPTGGGTTAPGNALGTRNYRGGMTWVGETGPELVALPRGSRIFSNSESMALAGAGNINVTVNVASVASNIDINALAYQVAREIQRRR